jgi:hypothetical protein
MSWKNGIDPGLSCNLLHGTNPEGSAYPLLLLHTVNGFFVFFSGIRFFLKGIILFWGIGNFRMLINKDRILISS